MCHLSWMHVACERSIVGLVVISIPYFNLPSILWAISSYVPDILQSIFLYTLRFSSFQKVVLFVWSSMKMSKKKKIKFSRIFLEDNGNKIIFSFLILSSIFFFTFLHRDHTNIHLKILQKTQWGPFVLKKENIKKIQNNQKGLHLGFSSHLLLLCVSVSCIIFSNCIIVANMSCLVQKLSLKTWF